MLDRAVTITLNLDQAVVLSDWLYRLMGTERFDSLVEEEPAVWSPLHHLSGTLETTLPEIFAADYHTRVAAAKQRLIGTLGDLGRARSPRQVLPAPTGTSPQPPPDTGPEPSDTPRQVMGWILEDNVVPLFRWVANFIGYSYDFLDEQALTGALDMTDDETDRWFEYPLIGSPAVTVRLARSPGTAVVMTQVRGDLDDVLAARVETLIAVLATLR